MARYVKQFLTDESGLEMVEYAVLTALIVGGLVLAASGMAMAMTGRFEFTQTTISDVS